MSTVANKDVMTVWWDRQFSTRNVTRFFGPWNQNQTSNPWRVPDKVQLDFWFINHVVPDAQAGTVQVRLVADGSVIAFEDYLSSENDDREVDVSQWTLLRGATLQIAISAGPALNDSDKFEFQFQLTGTWLRDT